jgi:pSer/pThr/pTyr-binding forkhead associated (FHA) protein
VRAGNARAFARYVDLAPQEQRALQEAVAATRRLRVEDLAAAQAARAPVPSGVQLFLTDGKGLTFGLDPRLEVVRLGRAVDNDVVADSQRVSRYHAQLRWVDSAWLAYDLDSTNGTWLNSDRVDPHHPVLLQAGSRLRLGDVELEVTRKPPRRGQH